MVSVVIVLQLMSPIHEIWSATSQLQICTHLAYFYAVFVVPKTIHRISRSLKTYWDTELVAKACGSSLYGIVTFSTALTWG